MNRPVSPPIAPSIAIIAAIGALLAGFLFALSALAESALPVVMQLMNWGR
jgi:hypothetical protein